MPPVRPFFGLFIVINFFILFLIQFSFSFVIITFSAGQVVNS